MYIIEENMSQDLKNRLKNIDETRHYFIEEINQHELTSKKHKGIVGLWIILNTYLFKFLQILDVFLFLILLL